MCRRLVVALLLASGTSALAATGCGQFKMGSKLGDGPDGPPAGKDAGAKPAPGADRKIIYTATLDVVVKDLAAARSDVDRLLAAHGGYVAKSEVKRYSPKSNGTATYTLRVPAGRFRPLLDALAGLGFPQKYGVDSQDVTEEYVDLRSRLESLKKEEAALDKLLEKAAQPTDVAAIRKERFPIREGIDKAEGRLKYLTTLTDLSTVELTLREEPDYVPPAPPTFAGRIVTVFQTSWELLVNLLQTVVFAAVALAAWLPLLLPLGVGAFYLGRRWLQAFRRPPFPPPARPGRAARADEPPPPAG